jgi:type III secretion system low calcium response chaperone LcrH/SycD
MHSQDAKGSPEPEVPSEAEVEQAAAGLLEFLARGGTVGDLTGLGAEHYEALYAIGHNQYAAGDHARAVETFRLLMMLNPWDRRFPMALGAAQQMNGKFDKALEAYMAAVMLDMMDPIAMFHVAECMVALGEIEGALEAMGFVLRHASKPEHEACRIRAQGLQPLLKAQLDAQSKTAP